MPTSDIIITEEPVVEVEEPFTPVTPPPKEEKVVVSTPPKAEKPKEKKKRAPKRPSEKTGVTPLAAANDPLLLEAKRELAEAAKVAKIALVEKAAVQPAVSFTKVAKINSKPDPQAKSGLLPPKPKSPKVKPALPKPSEEDLERIPGKAWKKFPARAYFSAGMSPAERKQAIAQDRERSHAIAEWLKNHPVKETQKAFVPTEQPAFKTGGACESFNAWTICLPNRGNGYKAEDFPASDCFGIYATCSYKPSFAWAVSEKSPYKLKPKVVKIYHNDGAAVQQSSPVKKFKTTPVGGSYNEVSGSLFQAPAGSILTHSIGADATLGKGIAKEIDRKTKAKLQLATRDLEVGTCEITHSKKYTVANLVTKPLSRKRPVGDLSPVENALLDMKAKIANIKGIIAMPLIECGLNGRQWEDVCPLIKTIFADRQVVVYTGLVPQSNMAEAPAPKKAVVPVAAPRVPKTKPVAAPRAVPPTPAPRVQVEEVVEVPPPSFTPEDFPALPGSSEEIEEEVVVSQPLEVLEAPQASTPETSELELLRRVIASQAEMIAKLTAQVEKLTTALARSV